MTQGRHPSDSAADGSIAAPARRAPRRLLARVLPGGVMVAAALTMPEFSVGAGDTGRRTPPADPPEPAARPDPAIAKRAAGTAAPTDPRLAGVRYAPVIDLGIAPARAAPRVRSLAARAASAVKPAGEAAAPARSAFDEAFADLAAPAPAPAALAAPSGSAPLIEAGSAATPAPPPAGLASAPEKAPRPAAAAGADASALASLLPEEQAALRAPAGAGTPPAALPASQPAPLAPPARVTSLATPAATPAPRPAAAAAAALPAGRGMIEQVTPARIAAARPAARAASVPADSPAAKETRLAAVSTPPPAARPAPAPAAAAAAVPKPAPGLGAPASAATPRIAEPDFRARLLTRVDGRAKGQLEFQQTAAGLKVRLGSVAEVLADRLAPDDLARIRGSASSNAWLSLAELQAQGIPISYDPVYDEFNIGREDTRPRSARKVHMDQISTPERSAGAGAMDQIRRR